MTASTQMPAPAASDRVSKAAPERPRDAAAAFISHPLIDDLADFDRLHEAWTRVRSAGGAAGVDDVHVALYAANVEQRLTQLAERLRERSYSPLPLKAMRLPTHVGAKRRELLVPTVEDRIVQRAFLDAAAPGCERVLLPCAHGYRKGRGIHSAVSSLRNAIDSRPWVADGDISDFFGSVSHAVLKDVLCRWFADAHTRSVVEMWVSLPAQRGDAVDPRDRGLPLGSPISPLLANLILHTLDRALWDGVLTYIRYADDFVACCAGRERAEAALLTARVVLGELGLTLNEAKSRVVDARAESLVFLGHLVRRAAGEAGRRTLDTPTTRTMYVTEPGSRLAKRGERLEVGRDGAPSASVPLRELRKVTVLAPVDITSPALVACLQRGIEVDFLTTHHRWQGRLEAWPSANPSLRHAQVLTSLDPESCMALARAFVCGKLHNQARLLQRYASRSEDPTVAAKAGEISGKLPAARRASGLDELRGVEGIASRTHFSALASLLPASFGFTGRVRRPPTDPVNALLSFGYTLLTGEAVGAVCGAGLDPYTGFLHQPRHGRHSLALDLVEEFRPVLVDALVLSLVHRKVIDGGDFVRDAATGATLLRDEPRRAVLREWEHRLLTLVTYELTGERVSYRRVLALQAQQIARVIEDPGASYVPVRLT